MGEEYIRAFIAIDIPGEMLSPLREELGRLRGRIKVVEEQNTHLTLKFLGNIKESAVPRVAEAVQECVHGQKKFSALIKGVGVFPSLSRARVFWVGVESDGIIENMAECIDEELHRLGYPRESKRFVPHITVARIKYLNDRGRLRKIVNAYSPHVFGEVIVDSVRVKKSVLSSRGPTYYTLSEIKLG